jgi:hypothetical protein
MKVDVEMAENGWIPKHDRVTDIDKHSDPGLDHVFLHLGPPPVNLVADSKYGAAKLSVLVDGTRQMSRAWIDKRLQDAVDDETFNLIRRKGYSAVVAKVAPNGKIKFQLLDADGFVIGKFDHKI